MSDKMMDGTMGGMWVLWVLLVLSVIALAVTAVIWLVHSMRGPTSSDGGSTANSRAREELDRRYAAGELSREEHLQRRSDLAG